MAEQENKSQIIIYQTESGNTKIDVRLENETVWLTQKLMAELFQTTKQNISLHIINIFEEGELKQESTVKNFLTVQNDGRDQYWSDLKRKLSKEGYSELYEKIVQLKLLCKDMSLIPESRWCRERILRN